MLTDECGCVVERKYASDFLSRQIFRVQKKPKGYEKIGEAEIDESRKFELYYGKNEKYPLKYSSTQCPLLIISLEALCEEFYEKRNLTLESAMNKIKSIKGLTVNEIVLKTIEEVVRILEKSGIHS